MKYRPTSPKQQKDHPPIVTGMDDLFTPIKPTARPTVPPIVYIVAFVVMVALMSLLASVLH